MIGNLRWNITFGVIGFIFPFIFSLGANPLSTILLRSFYSMVIMFAFGFCIRWILGTVAGLNSLRNGSDSAEEKHVGVNINAVTPIEDESLHEIIKQNVTHNRSTSTEELNSFSPLHPPKLVTKDNDKPDQLQPEKLAEAIRHLSDK
jgi:hypothetical protein